MQEEQTHTREQFIEMIKEGLVLINNDAGSKKSFRASDYITIGKLQHAIERYEFAQMLNKKYEQENP